ncbi:hypothetical protein [Acinetobacter sp. NRRL B-65365]|uniref:hypothetical protein n=1 Tax=Acinetobacter sp. NRRL B-65365 TaxID=1785092 RepID=UPI0012DE4755|nr:hypothetical protein [Acinetobacter sp. NRRL B-65365]
MSFEKPKGLSSELYSSIERLWLSTEQKIVYPAIRNPKTVNTAPKSVEAIAGIASTNSLFSIPRVENIDIILNISSRNLFVLEKGIFLEAI